MIAAALTVATPLAVIGGLTYASVAPRCTLWGPVVSRGRSDTSQVALTFDDGPTPGSTDQILDILRAEQSLATFFVIGRNVEANPDLLRRMHGEGHLIANHTWSHSHYASAHRWRWWEREIRQTDELIKSIVDNRPTSFRPPMGVRTWHTARAARQLDQTIVTWSHRAWDGLRTTPDRILHRFDNVSAGDILLMHDGVEPHSPHRDRSATVAALRPLLQRIRANGLSPARLDSLLHR